MRELAYERLVHYPGPADAPPIADVDAHARHAAKLFGLPEPAVRWMMRLAGLGRLAAFARADPAGFEDLCRSRPNRVALASFPALNATAVLAAEPAPRDPLARAAALIVAARAIRDDLRSGQLPADTRGDAPLEMGGYLNLFAGGVAAGGLCNTPRKAEDRDYAAVLVRGQPFALDLSGRDAAAIYAALVAIVAEARSAPDRPAIGAISSEGPSARIADVAALARGARGAEALARLGGATFVVSLDLHARPRDGDEAAAQIHAWGFENRWHFAALQIVVLGDATAGATFNFTCHVDGNVMTRFAAELARRAREIEAREGSAGPPPQRIDLAPSPALAAQAARRAEREIHRGRSSYRLDGIGAALLRERGLRADPAFNIALAIAARRVLGRVPSAVELATMSRYRCTGVTIARTTTPEVAAFAERAARAGPSGAEGAAAYAAAEASLRASVREARRFMPLPELLVLSLQQLAAPTPAAEVALPAAAWLASLVSPRPFDVIVSRPAEHPEVASFGRAGALLPYLSAFGLHYQIHEDAIALVYMPARGWPPRLAEITSELGAALRSLTSLPHPREGRALARDGGIV